LFEVAMSPPPRLGKYEIRRELGRGSMGVVYEAFDPFIQLPVAIKVIRQDEFQPSQVRELLPRLRREAQAAGRLNHPGIVAVYDYGEDETLGGSGLAYIAMELIDGRELKDYLDGNHPFTRADIVRIMTEVLNALQHAHERGVTHRDIKPSNVILLRNGSVKVADFGVARLDSSEMTQAGTMIGTPMYMAPEQILGLPVDGRCDLFACGVVLYQFLTGEKPFTGSLTTVMQKVLHSEPVPVTQLNAELAPEWDLVVKKALAKKPEQRFASAHAMAEAVLAAALAPPPDNQVTVLLPPRQPPVLPGSAPFRPIAGRDGQASPPTPTHPHTPTPTPTVRPSPSAPYIGPAAVPPPPAMPNGSTAHTHTHPHTPAPMPTAPAPAPRGPNRSFSPAPPAVAARSAAAGPLAGPMGGPMAGPAAGTVAGAPAWAPRGVEPTHGAPEEEAFAPTVRYTLKHLRPDGTGPASVPAGPPSSGFASSRMEMPAVAAASSRRSWVMWAGAAAVAALGLMGYKLWPGSRSPAPAAPTAPAASAPLQGAAPGGNATVAQAAAPTPLSPSPLPAPSPAPAPVPSAGPAPPPDARPVAAPKPIPPAPSLSPAPAPKPTPAAPGPAAAPAPTATAPSPAPVIAAPTQAPEWRQRVARLESARNAQSLADGLALLLEPLTADERSLLTEFEAQARQRIGAQVVVMGVQEGYLRTTWSMRGSASLSAAMESAQRRCNEWSAKGCSTVVLAGNFQRNGLVAVAGELGAVSPALVRSRLLRNVERTLTEWRASPPAAVAPPAANTAAAPTPAPAPSPAPPPARVEAAADPARGDWASSIARLRSETPASLASALELLLHVTEADDRERLRQLESALKRLRWKSAAALGDRNGFLWLNVTQGESRSQWAQDQALATCVNRGGAAPCVLVMADGQFSTGGLAAMGGRLSQRNQTQVREAFMRHLQRALQSGLN